jgi:O-antigen/teichoic acid export membrane protein
MKKRNVLQNSMIATICIIVCKIIGLIYVIPFYAMISTSAGALYSYAYNIYVIFLSLSTTGVPLAVSKIVSEYDSLEYYDTRDRAYSISMKLIFFIGLLCFIVMVLFARPMAFLILGGADGNNTVDDVANVIRIISLALLIVPPLSVVRGYLQGHNYITESSISNVIEQFVRVVVIFVGCILVIKVFHLDEKIAIGIAVFSAAVSAFASYLYLKYKIFKNKEQFDDKYEVKEAEKKITGRMIAKDVLLCALPFIIVEVLKSAYASVDTVTIVRGLTHLGYSVDVAETTFSVIATWGNKLCTVVISVAIGISMSLIPSVAGDYVKGEMKKVNDKYCSSMLLLLITTLPMTLGIFFLAQPVWIVFYGYDYLSIEVFKLYIFQAVTFSFFSVLISFCQTVGKTKIALFTLFVSFILNAIFNIPFMHLCHNLGFGGYQGATVCTLVTQTLPCLFLIVYIKKSFNFRYRSLFINSLKIVSCSVIMVAVLYLVKIIYPLDSFGRIGALIECVIYGLIGVIIYTFLLVKTGLFKDLFGNSRILKKLKLVK